MSRHIPETIQAIEPLRPDAPFRDVDFAPIDIQLTTRPDGSLILSNRLALAALPVQQIGEYLHRYAAERPNQTFLAEPGPDGQWQHLTYAQALAKANAVSQWLLDQQLPAERPILILSENSINQARLQFAAMQIGVPVMPVSPAYSLMSEACDGRCRANVDVPAGSQTGKTVRIKGKGMPHLNGRQRGDLVVELFVETPTDLTPRQKELMQELAASFGEDQSPRNSSFAGKAKRFWADILGSEAPQ